MKPFSVGMGGKDTNLKILLVYPRYPDTLWSFKHALRFVSIKAAFPPLGLLTVAAMLPIEWEKKLVDMNVIALTDEDLKWADYVFISAMVVQKDSAREVIARCNNCNTRIVAGGPLFTSEYKEFDGVDHFVLGEAEITLPLFLEDLSRERARHIYMSDERPDITKTPIPMWSLINMKKYSRMNIQYSRGCPFNCEFCQIIILNGRTPRTKEKTQILAELDALYNHGWRGGVFVVDDNFIGNKIKLKTDILPAIIKWEEMRKYPFDLSTEASINLADDEELMRLMVKAGFDSVFVGIETPDEESLTECNKLQNRNRDLVQSVRKLQNHGFEVLGGFIVGFDSDRLSIFKEQVSFIQKSGIVTAMVGLLNAPRGTRLYQRLIKEHRLLNDGTGDNTDSSINFIPRMDYQTLITGYKNILDTIYSPKHYYQRIRTFLGEYKPKRKRGPQLQLRYLWAFAKSMWFLGIKEKGRWYYWEFLASTFVRNTRNFPLCMNLAVYGFHFRKVAEKLTY